MCAQVFIYVCLFCHRKSTQEHIGPEKEKEEEKKNSTDEYMAAFLMLKLRGCYSVD